MHNRSFPLLATVLLAATATAQIWTPNGYAATAGNSNNAYPWNRGAAAMHYLQVYSGTNFTLQGANFPILINRMRFRTSAGSSATGGSWSNVVINMSQAATTVSTISTTFAANHGGTIVNAYAGPVTVMPVAAATPGNVYVDITLTNPVLYNPTGGDLCMEVVLDGVGWTGGSAQCDAVSQTGPAGPALSRRIYNTTSHTATTGSTDGYDYGLATEFTFTPGTGYAYAASYGTGCYSRTSSFYQLFANAGFNLANNSIQMIPTGNGYLVIPGTTPWRTPTGPNLGLTDDSVSAGQTVPFTFNYPGGNTTSMFVSSNGYVWMQTSTNNGCCGGSPGDLLSMGARYCPLWNDLNPGVGGQVQFDSDPANGLVCVTWTNVPEYGTSNLNTFQIAFYSSGIVEMRWQACSVLSHAVLTGWSPGGGARDPGSINILTSLPLTTGPDTSPVALGASARPVIGTTINLVTSNIPAGTPIGASILSFTQVNPGADLTSLGMPGCLRFVGLDATRLFVVGGVTANAPLVIPNFPGLAGLRVHSQSATFTPGLNPLGVIATNGLTLVVNPL